MNTLQLLVTEKELKEYQFLQSKNITFAELKKKLLLESAKKALISSNKIAKKTGLSDLTLEEINSEIKAVRDAQNYS